MQVTQELSFYAYGELSSLRVKMNYAPDTAQPWACEMPVLQDFYITAAAHNGSKVTDDGWVAIRLGGNNPVFEGSYWLVLDDFSYPTRVQVEKNLPKDKEWNPYPAANFLYDVLLVWWKDEGRDKYANASRTDKVLAQLHQLEKGPWTRLFVDCSTESVVTSATGSQMEVMEVEITMKSVTAMDGSYLFITDDGPKLMMDREIREIINEGSEMSEHELMKMEAKGLA